MIRFQRETLIELERLSNGKPDGVAAAIATIHDEPLLLILDSLLRYAKAYRKRFEEPVSASHDLGQAFLACLVGVRGLLAGDGAIALEKRIATDSKSNAMLKRLYRIVLGEAGFQEADAHKAMYEAEPDTDIADLSEIIVESYDSDLIADDETLVDGYSI